MNSMKPPPRAVEHGQKSTYLLPRVSQRRTIHPFIHAIDVTDLIATVPGLNTTRCLGRYLGS